MDRLSIRQIRLFAQQLPSPCGVYRVRGVRFHVYRTKELWSPRWLNPAAKALVTEARYSYSRYGNRPPLDDLDPKAAVYLVKAAYRDMESGLMAEEWLSNRFVPGWGKPLGVHEPEIFFYKHRSVDRWLKDLICDNKRYYWSNLLSYSRMCRILPYLQECPDKNPDEFLFDRLRNTPILFALTCEQFIRDYLSGEYPWKVITGIIGDEFVNKGLVVDHNGKLFKPAFTPAHRFLNVQRKEVTLNRAVYTYEYPLYWLNIHELSRLLDKLHQRKVLTDESFIHYLGVNVNVRDLEHDKIALGKLGNLLSVRGSIVGGRLTGEELRALVDRHVSDGPQLRITPIKKMVQSTRRILRAAGVENVC